MKILANDLSALHDPLKEELLSVFTDCLTKSAYISGEYNLAFEKDFGQITGASAQNVIGVSSGTSALYASLKVLGINHGDEVIVPAHTWISTASAVAECGATPIFADINPDTFNIDVNEIKRVLSSKTKAVIAVHLYGLPCNILEIASLCKANNLKLIEDCAQAHLAMHDGKTVGLIGDIGCYSFYPGKNLGALGDAGCVTTNDSDLATKVRKFINHGQLNKHHHEFWGTNARMDNMQAGFLSVKLKHLYDWTEARIKIAAIYDQELSGLQEIKIQKKALNQKHVYHQYVVQYEKRDELRAHLLNKGIQVLINYPNSLDELSMIKRTQKRCVNSRLHSRNLLCLPIYPQMSEQNAKLVCSTIKEYFKIHG